MTARPVIAIDASRAFAAERTGTETYSFHLLQALVRRSPGWRQCAYVNAGEIDTSIVPDSLEIRAIPFLPLWTHGRLSFEMLRQAPDLLFVPAHVIPVTQPASVVTIHHLGYLHLPGSHPPTAASHARSDDASECARWPADHRAVRRHVTSSDAAPWRRSRNRDGDSLRSFAGIRSSFSSGRPG